MRRVTTVELLDIERVLAFSEDLWIDQVYYDIPETLVAVVNRAPLNVVAITFYEHLWLLRHLYEEVFQVCEERRITMVKAKTFTYERIWP